MAVNFMLKSEFQTIHRRPFSLAAPATLKPTDVRPLVDGEWLELDGTYKMARGGNNAGNLTDEATVPSFEAGPAVQTGHAVVSIGGSGRSFDHE